jgi:hypothetical protein
LRGLAASRRDHVDFWIIGRRIGHAASDFEDRGISIRSILQAMTVLITRFEPGGVAGA